MGWNIRQIRSDLCFSLFFLLNFCKIASKVLEPQRNDFVLFNPNFGAEIFDGVSRTRHEPRAMILFEIWNQNGLRLRHSTCRKWFPNQCNSIYESIQFFRSVSEGFPEALLLGLRFGGFCRGRQAVEVPHVHEAAAPWLCQWEGMVLFGGSGVLPFCLSIVIFREFQGVFFFWLDNSKEFNHSKYFLAPK